MNKVFYYVASSLDASISGAKAISPNSFPTASQSKNINPIYWTFAPLSLGEKHTNSAIDTDFRTHEVSGH